MRAMNKTIDVEAILAPIEGENPAGESLRYTPLYDEIQEARRADDILDRGDWQHEIKTSDWGRVYVLTTEALTEKTKDLQLAVWLLEALCYTQGFAGVSTGLKILTGFLQDFWETVYPEIEDDDLDFRVGPLEFLNEKVWMPIKQISLTDRSSTPGYSWMKWQESRQVGSEKDTLNQFGDVDDDKVETRKELIAEGKITTEDFDGAVKSSSRAFYETLAGDIAACLEGFKIFDETVDEKFGKEAPRLAEFKNALEDCDHVISRILKEKRELEPDAEPEPAVVEDEGEGEVQAAPDEAESVGSEPVPVQPVQSTAAAEAPISVGTYRVNRLLGSAGIEEAVWKDALEKLRKEGIKPALEQLLGASCSAQSVRERSNFRLLMARLCLEADRPDLARPIVEELNTLIEELQLERWESPIWVAEALDTLYKCLTAEGASDDDMYRASELLTKLCTLDVTKAMKYSE